MTSAELPTVSVVIPAHNAGMYLSDAIKSVLAQTRAPVEVIVVDDESTDDTASVARSFGDRIRLIQQAKAGANAARNLGVSASSGEFISFLDADDLWDPSKLELQLLAFENDLEPQVVFGMVTQFRSPEIDPLRLPMADGADAPMIGHHAGAMLLRREVFDAIGPFDATIRIGQFIDWFSRALDTRCRMVVIDDVVMRRRLHLDNMGRHHDAGPNQYAKALRLVLERRRAAVI